MSQAPTEPVSEQDEEDFRYGSSRMTEGFLIQRYPHRFIRCFPPSSERLYYRLEAQTLTSYQNNKIKTPVAHYALAKASISANSNTQQITLDLKGNKGKSVILEPDSSENAEQRAQSYKKWEEAFHKVNKNTIEDFYEVKKTLGSGSFGTVYLGVDKRTMEECAIKKIDKRHVDPEEKTMMIRELRIMRTIKHQNIVQTFDLFDEKNNMFMVMELMKGGTLDDALKRRDTGFSQWETREAMRQILQGVKCLHDNNIVHRDLKTKNILVAMHKAPFGIKITDFGLSNFLGTNTMSLAGLKSQVGSPHYVAPEIILEQRYGPSVDLWSCGVIMYVLLLKKKPLSGSTVQETLNKVVNEDIQLNEPIWSDMPEAKTFLTRLLQKNPHLRYTAEAALQDPWMSMTLKEENTIRK